MIFCNVGRNEISVYQPFVKVSYLLGVEVDFFAVSSRISGFDKRFHEIKYGLRGRFGLCR